MKAVEKFTKSQAKRLKQEIRRQVALENEKYERSFDILLMYILHSAFGFGQARLSRMYASMRESRDELKKRNMADGDADSADYICAMKRDLRQSGVGVNGILQSAGHRTGETK